MAKTNRTCRHPECYTKLKASETHCKQHAHVNALQQTIDDLTLRKGGGISGLLQYDPIWRLLRVVGEAHWLAQPGQGSSLASVVGRGGFDDGQVEYGERVLHSASAAAVKSYQGKLGAVLSEVRRCVDRCEDILDPNRERKDTRVTCGRAECRHKWKKQPPDSFYCRYCGEPMKEEAA